MKKANYSVSGKPLTVGIRRKRELGSIILKGLQYFLPIQRRVRPLIPSNAIWWDLTSTKNFTPSLSPISLRVLIPIQGPPQTYSLTRKREKSLTRKSEFEQSFLLNWALLHFLSGAFLSQGTKIRELMRSKGLGYCI